MNIRNIKFAIVVIALIFSSPSIQAEQICNNFDAEPEHFKSVYSRAKALGTEICLSFGEKINNNELADQYAAFVDHVSEQTAEAFQGKSFLPELLTQMQHFSDLAKNGVEKKTLPSFVTQEDSRESSGGLDSTKVFFFFTSTDKKGSADLGADECNQADLPSCKDLFESLETAIEQYKKPYSSLSGTDLSRRTAVLSAEWNRYLEVARSQTLLDALLTTTLELDHLSQNRLVGPMQRQWFAIHPSIVIENVSDAADGDQLVEALAIEWIGVNWWNKKTSPIGYPIGISLASIYSDRSTVDDDGHGLMIHIDNSISIGWVNHGGDDGVFVTVDFLNLFAKKKKRWNEYRDKIKEISAGN